MKIKVGFVTYKVGAMDVRLASAKGAFGVINHAAQSILIEEGLSLERYKEVLLHEVLHAVHMVWDIESPAQEESVVTKMANGLTTVFRDNPKLKETLF